MFDGISTFALIIYVILLLIALLVLTFVVLLVHSGLFTSVDDVGTGKPPIGQAIIAYRFQKGPYNQAGQIFTEAALIAPDNKALGIYYDDPNKVDSYNLRYVVGSILSEGNAPVDEEMVKKFTDKEFKILHLPEVSYAVHTQFPHITTLSILIATNKAYPRLKEYIEERKLCAYPFIEYYDGKVIHFMAPLSKQEEFFVPECEQEAGGDQPSTECESTMLSTSQSSEEDYNQQDVTQTSVDDDSEKNEEAEPVQEQANGDAECIQKVADCNAEAAGNENNSCLKATEDDQGSDDSSSSFELLKHDIAE
ncbi:testis-expressed protein 264-like [Physella acuta]|uniref:testis-expressed protein 264-like n=1 Tax=Physella acuta TaxID=109671 RepID=UPI0027DAF8D4|nr:testis-expressed protein 264-like [Physella acuta]